MEELFSLPNVRAVKTDLFRKPKKGELYLDGTVRLATKKISTEHWIMKLKNCARIPD